MAQGTQYTMCSFVVRPPLHLHPCLLYPIPSAASKSAKQKLATGNEAGGNIATNRRKNQIADQI